MASGTTLKAGSDDDGPTGRGPLPDCDPLPLTSDGVGVVPTGSYPACESRVDRAPVCPSDRPDCSTAPTAGGASSGRKSCVGTGPVAAQAPVCSSYHLARSAASAAGDNGTSGTTEGHGDRVRFTARSPTASALAARYLDAGTSAHRAASCSSPTDAAVGS